MLKAKLLIGMVKVCGVMIVATCVYACSGQDEQGQAEGAGPGLELTEENALAVSAVFPDNKSFMNLDGSPVDLASLEGKSIMVNYWATWCAPCIREIPSLIRAADELGDDFVVMLASDETPEQIMAFITENNFREDAFVKLEGSFAGHQIQAVPSTSLFGTDGVQKGQWLGVLEWDHEEVVDGLKALAR